MKKTPTTNHQPPIAPGDIATLAAAAMGANPALSMEDAVQSAMETLRRAMNIQLSEKQIKDSVRADAIMCFEDSTWHTMMRRYIKRKFNMTPEQYKIKWGLPDNYPMVAKDYATTRSAIAKKAGLGRK
ncbi:MAG: MucR family transcriptional regulator [Alphaproteobacteria bacterium]|nr:MucR family transcriptional regulator [Alphaproteobacteria bacterium]